MSNLKKLKLVHPILFATFPVMFLFSHNVNQVSLSEIALPLVIVICFTLLLWLLFILLIKDKVKAGIIVSIFLLLFFSYGHVFDVISGLSVGELLIGRPKYLIIFWGIIFLSGSYLITKTHKNLHNLTTLLNFIALSLCAISIITALYDYTWHHNINTENKIENEEDLTNFVKSGKHPDIYYIILDGYARADILKEIYKYNNSIFLDRLAQKGFYIAKQSRANYAHTLSSLASSFNFNYLDDLINRYGTEPKNTYWPLMKKIKNNRVFKFLKKRGYRIVFASTTRFFDDAKNAFDINIETPNWSLTEFQNELINTTPIPITLIYLYEKTGKLGDFRAELQRKRVLYAFEHIADMAKRERDYPVFVFAHIIAPHVPFVFGKHGEEINPNRKFSHRGASYTRREKYIDNYRNQLIFVSKKIDSVIDDILYSSPEPPIIILQSDHGTDAPIFDWRQPDNSELKERMSILNTYYLPENDYRMLYNTITPVNTFRIIFNQYFGTNYKLLKDESYFSAPKSYKFIDVTNQVSSSP